MNKLKITSLLTLVAVLSSALCQCQTFNKVVSNKLPEELITSINKRILAELTPSVAIAIINKNDIAYFNFGKTKQGGKAVDENTIYEIGSISKVFTGILLAQKVVEHDLKLADNINEYLPAEVNVPVIGKKEITFGNLSDHTSGLPRMPDNFAPANKNNPYADYTVNQMYSFISNYKPIREVGTEYEYSNIGQGLLGHILALNMNTTYEQLMIKTIAEPLEMNDTKIEFNERMKVNLAFGHSGGNIVENWDVPTFAGAGAIRSSTSDMAKFMSANLGYLKSPLSPAMELAHKKRHSKAGEMQVALGWHVMKGNEGDIYYHSGATGGYRAFVGFVRETGIGVVVLTNSNFAVDDIGYYLLDSGSELAEIKLKNDAVELPESTLKKYIGVYEINPDFKLTVTKQGSQLYIRPTGQENVEIYSRNKTVFFLTIIDIEITFNLNEGVTESLTLLEGGKKIVAKKIE